MYKKINKPLFLVLAFFLWAADSHAKINVFACEPEWASLAKALGGDRVTVFSATSPLQDPHHIQARPSLIAKARRADLLVCTGAELEAGWLPLLLRKSGNGKILSGQTGHFMASEHVTLLEKPKQLDRSQGDIHADGNPHVHLDPHRMLQIAEALVNTLNRIDPANKTSYQKNWTNFHDNWSAAIINWEQKYQSLRGKKIVVNHNSWVYLEDWLQLKRLATLEPKPGIAPSSVHLSKVLAQMTNEPSDMILYASYQGDKAVLWLAQKTNIPAVKLPFSVSGDESLFQWFERLLKQLLDAQS